jgi:hypothetical protein
MVWALSFLIVCIVVIVMMFIPAQDSAAPGNQNPAAPLNRSVLVGDGLDAVKELGQLLDESTLLSDLTSNKLGSLITKLEGFKRAVVSGVGAKKSNDPALNGRVDSLIRSTRSLESQSAQIRQLPEQIRFLQRSGLRGIAEVPESIPWIRLIRVRPVIDRGFSFDERLTTPPNLGSLNQAADALSPRERLTSMQRVIAEALAVRNELLLLLDYDWRLVASITAQTNSPLVAASNSPLSGFFSDSRSLAVVFAGFLAVLLALFTLRKIVALTKVVQAIALLKKSPSPSVPNIQSIDWRLFDESYSEISAIREGLLSRKSLPPDAKSQLVKIDGFQVLEHQLQEVQNRADIWAQDFERAENHQNLLYEINRIRDQISDLRASLKGLIKDLKSQSESGQKLGLSLHDHQLDSIISSANHAMDALHMFRENALIGRSGAAPVQAASRSLDS